MAGVYIDKTKSIGGNSNFKATITYVDPITGETKEGKIGGENYKYDDWFHTSRNTDVVYTIDYMLKNGWNFENPSMSNKEFAEYLSNITGNPVASNEIPEILADAKQFINKNTSGIDSINEYYKTQMSEQSAQESAYNAYYNDLYSLDEGTFGREMLDNYTQAEQNAAMSNMQLAEAQYQQSAMQQAEVVKSITDQVKAERMARLRAGMSESQIANQDMQTMLNNMNTLNQQAATMNQNRLAAQQQYNLAQDTAYQQYIQSLTGLGGTSAAMAASDAGDAYMQTLKRMKATGEKYNTASKAVTGSGS